MAIPAPKELTAKIPFAPGGAPSPEGYVKANAVVAYRFWVCGTGYFVSFALRPDLTEHGTEYFHRGRLIHARTEPDRGRLVNMAADVMSSGKRLATLKRWAQKSPLATGCENNNANFHRIGDVAPAMAATDHVSEIDFLQSLFLHVAPTNETLRNAAAERADELQIVAERSRLNEQQEEERRRSPQVTTEVGNRRGPVVVPISESEAPGPVTIAPDCSVRPGDELRPCTPEERAILAEARRRSNKDALAEGIGSRSAPRSAAPTTTSTKRGPTKAQPVALSDEVERAEKALEIARQQRAGTVKIAPANAPRRRPLSKDPVERAEQLMEEARRKRQSDDPVERAEQALEDARERRAAGSPAKTTPSNAAPTRTASKPPTKYPTPPTKTVKPPECKAAKHTSCVKEQ